METRINTTWRSNVNAKLGKALAKTGISPNALTLIGILFSLMAAVAIVQYGLLLGAFAMLFAAFFDLLDGAVAKATNRTTKFGAFLDEISDRAGEACYFSAIFLLNPFFSVFLAAVTSVLVSYIKLSAERRGFRILSGTVSGRPVRIGLLFVFMLLSPAIGISDSVWLITALNIFTILTRIREVMAQDVSA